MLKNIFNRIINGKPKNPEPPSTVRAIPSEWTPDRSPKGPLSKLKWNTAAYGNGFVYNGSNRGDFYRYLRDSIPIVSAAVWTWRRLCATPQTLTIEGSDSEISAAWKIVEELDRRIHQNRYLRGSGVNRLCEDFFLEIFTTGTFAGFIVPYADGGGIDYFQQIDSSLVHWENRDGLQPYFEDERGNKVYFPRETFFYSALGTDIKNPGGIEPLASIPFVVAIEQMMLEDMARSSHNAGNPRLNVRINPPERFDAEGDAEYVERINSYFDGTVNQFSRLEPDENLFTWSDVEIKVVGAEPGRSYVWKLNREQVIEDVITGLKLFPWALGRPHNATKNWVQAQFNILMQIVDSIQQSGAEFADWLRTTELRMKGNLARPSHRFAPNQDPFLLEKRKAEEIHFRTVHAKHKEGYISQDTAAREMGYRN